MKKHIIAGALSLIFFVACKKEEKHYSPPDPAQETADVKLLRELSLCANSENGTADKDCLQKNFSPFLGLGPKDELIYDGGFGVNTGGRYFTMHVRKASVSGKTSGTFTLVFYMERHEDNPNSPGNSCTFFRATDGKSYGSPKKDIEGLLDIYDLDRSDYLVSGTNGEVSSMGRLFDSGPCISNPRGRSSMECQRYVWSPERTASNLVNSGKTIGEIIGEYLEYTEKQEAEK